MLTTEEINDLVDRIVKRLDPHKVIIFGSYAKGTSTPTSDLDILVVKESEKLMASRAEELMPIFANMQIRVDVHVYTPEEIEAYGTDQFSFVSNVLRTGKVAYERFQ